MNTLNEIYLELLDAQKDAAIEKDMSLKSVEHCILFINVLRKGYPDNKLEWPLYLDLHPDTFMSLFFRKEKDSGSLLFQDNATVSYAFANKETEETHRGHFSFPTSINSEVPKNIMYLIDRFVQKKKAALTCPEQCGRIYTQGAST